MFESVAAAVMVMIVFGGILGKGPERGRERKAESTEAARASPSLKERSGLKVELVVLEKGLQQVSWWSGGYQCPDRTLLVAHEY